MDWRKYSITVCLIGIILALAFTQISGSQITWQYDPWADINDDGKIDVKDIAFVSKWFGKVITA